jgi:hypothetical protein
MARQRIQTTQPDFFQIKSVADGVYAAVAAPTYKGNSNGAIIVNEDGVVVVDSHSKPSAARVLEVAPRYEKPFSKYPVYRPWRRQVLVNIERIYAAVDWALRSYSPGVFPPTRPAPTLDRALRQRSCYTEED